MLEVLRNVQQYIQTILNAHVTHVTDEVALSIFPRGIGGNRLECFPFRPITDNEHIFWSHAASVHRQILIAPVRCYHDIAEPIGKFFQSHQDPVERSLFPVFRNVQFWIYIVVVKNVLHSKEFERQCDQKNIIGRIATLNDIKSMPQIDPQRIPKLPEQRATVLPQIPHRSASLRWRGMSIDADSVNNFVSCGARFSSGTQNRHFVSALPKRTSLPPNTSIEGNRLVLYDDQDPSI